MDVRSALDLLPGATGIMSAGRWVYANPALTAMIGRPLVGDLVVDLVAPQCEGVHATRWCRHDGRELAVELSIRALVHEGEDSFLVAITACDITVDRSRERERALAEADLRESETRYRMLFDGCPLPICVFDAETFRYLAVNEKMSDVYGYTRDELLAMTVKDVKFDEDVPIMQRAVSAGAVGQQTRVGVMRHRRKDGVPLAIDVTSHQILLGGRRCVLAIGVDVTESRKLEEHLRQSQKMEAVGQLAGGVAHDFNNMLAVVMSTACCLREDLGDAHPNAGDVIEIQAAAERAAALTRQLLSFSRKQPSSPRLVSLRSIVSGLENMLRRLVSANVDLSTQLGATATTYADPGQLEQVLMNLVVNARDAMPDGGRLTIETSEVELTDAGAIEIGVPAGRYSVLSVTDTGVGMDVATQRRIFEPFFTTKEVGRGTGLGLASVFGIVQQAEGAVAVRSELGRGSTFSVYLPRATGQATNESVIAATPAVRGSGSVLIVEDDSHLRSLLHQRLHSLGYQTTVAHDAVSAFEALLQPGASIDLLLTDLVLPGIDGRALAKRITAQRPQVQVVFMSGYSEHVASPASVMGTARREHFIQKPFTLDELSRVLRHALESRPSHEERTGVRR